MADPGLSHRLSQRSRRAGLMIGISMVLTIAFCAVAFTVIYTALEGFTTDFVSGTDKTATVTDQEAADSQATETSSTDGNGSGAASDAGEIAPNLEDALPSPTPPNENQDEDQAQSTDDDEFDPDYQLKRENSINLREGPSTANSIVDTLPPSTPLEYLNEDAPTQSPQDGDRWMKFRTEDGQEGWIREIDVTDYEP